MTSFTDLSIVEIFFDVLNDDTLGVEFIIDPIQKNPDQFLLKQISLLTFQKFQSPDNF